MKRMTRPIAAVIALLMLTLLAACGGSGGTAGTDPAAMDAIETGVTEAMSEYPMTMFTRTNSEDENFAGHMASIGMTPEIVEDAFIAQSSVIISSNFIIVLRVNDMEKAKTELAEFHQTQLNNWSTYLPDQYQKAENNITESVGEYLYYVTADNQDDIVALIKAALE